MPVLISERVIQLEMADLLKRLPLQIPAKPRPRSPGVHLSGVLQYVAHEIGVLKPQEKDEEEYPLIWGLGQAWEEWIFSFFPEIEWQPGERTADGVSMNADGLSYDTEGDELWGEEAKFTFKSVATGEEFVKDKKWWLYRMQAGGFCHGHGNRVCRWHVCHVRGDYREFGPVYKQYVLRYTDKEVSQIWKMVQNHKQFAVPEAA